MRNRHSDHMSIFGDTHEGVVSPLVPHTHPWPTRFHGPNYLIPRFGMPYRQMPWTSPPLYRDGVVIGALRNPKNPYYFGVVKPLLGTGALSDKEKLKVSIVAAAAMVLVVGGIAIALSD